MRWLLEAVGRAGERTGRLEIGGAVVGTPSPLLTLKGGLLPHLTKETLAHLLWAKGAPIIAPLQHHVDQGPVLEHWGKGLASFLGLGEHPLLVTLHDSTEELRHGYNQKKSVSIWQYGTNQIHFDPLKFMSLMEAIKPAAMLALCDGDTPAGCSNKRVSHSVAKSVEFLESCIEKASISPILESTPIIGAVEGGLELKARRKSAGEVAKQPVGGFLLDGFHHGPNCEQLNFAMIREALEESVDLLPDDKPRFFLGPAPPHLVFDLVEAGIDVFDCTFPNMVTERDSMLVFPYTLDDSCGVKSEYAEGKYEASLASDQFRMDFGPLVAGCTCYTCSNFTRAYLHHLVATKEMLARVLLTLHNLHHYQAFFVALQLAIRDGQLDELRRVVMRGYHHPAG